MRERKEVSGSRGAMDRKLTIGEHGLQRRTDDDRSVVQADGNGDRAGHVRIFSALAGSQPAAADGFCRELQQLRGNRYTRQVILEGLGAEEEIRESEFAEEPKAFVRESDGRESLADGDEARLDRAAGHLLPRVFVDGGKTGSASVHWAGGGGGRGNQVTGSVTQVAPVIETSAPPASGGTAKAWIRAGTGTARVTRSYVGVLTGANGSNYYITAAGSARIDRHEQAHTNSSRTIHDAQIVPLEQRVTSRTGQANALNQGATEAEARTALETAINWSTTISAFSTQDTAANTPYGTVDVAELAAADYIRDYGPQTVGGVNYAHYIDIPPGPAPPPPPTPAPAPSGGGP